MLDVPQKGLVTIQGFKPIGASPVSRLCNSDAEAKKSFDAIGSYLDYIEIAHNDILVLKYIPTQLGSLLTSAETQNEQRWQNKCGLVLKYGPKAKEDGFLYDVGDWVFYRSSDGVEIGIKCENGTEIAHSLILSPAHVIGRVSNPDILW